MRKLSITLVAALATIGMATAAQAQSKCTGGKLKAAGKYAACELGAYGNDAAKGGGAVLIKCQEAFANAFSKVASGTNDCLAPNGDQGTIQSKVDAFASDVNTTIRASNTLPSKCIAQKLKAAGKKAGCKLGVHAKAVLKGLPLDTAKFDACSTKFTAASTKADGGSDCGSAASDTGTIEGKVDAFVSDVNAELTAATTTTNSTTSTITTSTSTTIPCESSGFPTCGGTCPDTDLGFPQACQALDTIVCPGFQHVTSCACSPGGPNSCGTVCANPGPGFLCPPNQTCQHLDPSCLSCAAGCVAQ